MLFLLSTSMLVFTAFTPNDRAADRDFGVVLNEVIPLAFTVAACDELVDMSGTEHIVISETNSSNGNYHYHVHQNIKLQGIGQTSGAKYQAQATAQDRVNLTQGGDGCCGNASIVIQVKIIGQGKATDYHAKQLTHITVNANGDVTAFIDKFEVECK